MTFDTLAITDEELIVAAEILGVAVKNQQTLGNLINDGLDASSLSLLQSALSLNSSEFSRLLNISTRTLSRRKASKKLSKNESQYIFLLATMVATANDVLVEGDLVLRWLKSPKKVFNGLTPLEHVKVTQKPDEIISVLHQIEHGGFI